jgi:hypothetical protein
MITIIGGIQTGQKKNHSELKQIKSGTSCHCLIEIFFSKSEMFQLIITGGLHSGKKYVILFCEQENYGEKKLLVKFQTIFDCMPLLIGKKNGKIKSSH